VLGGSLVVGIGASAGGLAAFKTFLANTPADTGMAFILVHRPAAWRSS
jgi:two-component system CheB/CheR fusion protein